MKEIYEMDVYRLSEQLSDRIWDAFDRWTVKAQNTIGYQDNISKFDEFVKSPTTTFTVIPAKAGIQSF